MSNNGSRNEERRVAEYLALRGLLRNPGGLIAGIVGFIVLWIIGYWIVVGLIKLVALVVLVIVQAI